LGAIITEAAAGGRAEILFFCPLNNARFHRLPVGQISRNLQKRRASVSSVGHLENICENLPVRGLFSQKNLHFGLIEVTDFQLPESISPQRLQILESHDRFDTVGMNSK